MIELALKRAKLRKRLEKTGIDFLEQQGISVSVHDLPQEYKSFIGLVNSDRVKVDAKDPFHLTYEMVDAAFKSILNKRGIPPDQLSKKLEEEFLKYRSELNGC
jgi:hypothetical protein